MQGCVVGGTGLFGGGTGLFRRRIGLFRGGAGVRLFVMWGRQNCLEEGPDCLGEG